MTRASKVLMVFLVFASVAFMGFAAVSSMTVTDWKSRTKDLTEKTQKQTAEITKLDQEIPPWQAVLKDATEAKARDIEAMQNREVVLLAELKKLSETAATLSVQTVEKAKAAQEKRDEAAQRREEALALRNQLDELRTQKEEALAEQKRLTDLLVQALGTRERAERRKELLESDGAKPYDEVTAPAKP